MTTETFKASSVNEEVVNEEDSERDHARRRSRKVYSVANAVNEEDPECDRATQV